MGDRQDTKIISGIFYQLSPRRETFEKQSRMWWAIFIIVVGGSLALLAGLFILAARSVSQIGIQVVLTTFLITIGMAIVLAIKDLKVTDQALTVAQGYALFLVMCLVVALAALPLSMIFLPEMGFLLWVAITGGGLTLSFALLVLRDFYPELRERGTAGILTISGILIVFAIVYMTSIAPFIVPYDPFTINAGPVLAPPSDAFPLGTTNLGQDMLSRVLAGGATMLQVAAISVAVCFTIGVPVGLLASYRGGITDRLLSLVMDSIFAFPGLVLAIAIAAMLGPGAINMAISIAVVYIPSYFRVVRSQVLTIRELPYVEAAVVMGARDRDIMFRYILPNALPSAMVVMSINFADAVLTAAGLTFVGLGLPVDIADWGWDLTAGRNQMIVGAWWMSSFPGLMIVILALGFTLAGDGLNEILTPKLQE
ncbi:MAG: ABC transporter permease [Candidatus Thorarchaeota archaeon]